MEYAAGSLSTPVASHSPDLKSVRETAEPVALFIEEQVRRGARGPVFRVEREGRELVNWLCVPWIRGGGVWEREGRAGGGEGNEPLA
jgi:hypothetical protein